MSVSPVPPETGYATAYQAVEFYFSHGYVLQYSVGDQFLYNPYPYVGYFYLDPGDINADNIYDLFALYGFPTPPPDLKLNNIRIVQQTFPELPCNLGYTQTMKQRSHSHRRDETAPLAAVIVHLIHCSQQSLRV